MIDDKNKHQPTAPVDASEGTPSPSPLGPISYGEIRLSGFSSPRGYLEIFGGGSNQFWFFI